MIGQTVPHGSTPETRPSQRLQRPTGVIVVCANGAGMLESKLQIAFRIGQQFASHVQVIFFREVESSAMSSRMIPDDDPAWQNLARSKWETETACMDDAKRTFDLCLASIGAGRTAVVGGPARESAVTNRDTSTKPEKGSSFAGERAERHAAPVTPSARRASPRPGSVRSARRA